MTADKEIWRGVTPAVTTPFASTGDVDIPRWKAHCRWLVENGSGSLIVLGSVGEGGTLGEAERQLLTRTAIDAVDGRVSVVVAVSGLATHEVVRQARVAKEAGAHGLMVLPPYVYPGDRREVRAHFSQVIGGTDLPCMLYNNPPVYGTDAPPELVLDLASEHSNLAAVKESSGDARRITALRALLGDRLDLVVGVDDLVLEGVAAGAVGWVGGLANALPRESLELFRELTPSASARGREIYRWFLPLLRMDTRPKFVQLIKLVEHEVGWGEPHVRAPRLELSAPELEEARTTIRDAIGRRPGNLAASTPPTTS